MKPRAYIAHRISGRVRLRIRQESADPGYFEEVRSELTSISGIDEVKVNSTTGSILLRHPGLPYAELETQLRELELFELAEGPEGEVSALTPLLTGVTAIDRAISRGTSGIADLRTIAFVAFVLFAVRQISRGQFLGPALPLLWHAMELLMRFGRTKINREESNVTKLLHPD